MSTQRAETSKQNTCVVANAKLHGLVPEQFVMNSFIPVKETKEQGEHVGKTGKTCNPTKCTQSPISSNCGTCSARHERGHQTRRPCPCFPHLDTHVSSLRPVRKAAAGADGEREFDAATRGQHQVLVIVLCSEVPNSFLTRTEECAHTKPSTPHCMAFLQLPLSVEEDVRIADSRLLAQECRSQHTYYTQTRLWGGCAGSFRMPSRLGNFNTSYSCRCCHRVREPDFSGQFNKARMGSGRGFLPAFEISTKLLT